MAIIFFYLCQIKKTNEISKIFTPTRIIIAVLLGLSVSFYMMAKDFDADTYGNIHWSLRSGFFLLLAIILEAIRDIAYMYRIRLLTDKKISWRNSFQTIMLWEFASALTPSVVGGSAVALYIVNKEIDNVGKSTAVVMITALLDELFYIVMVPLVFIFVGYNELFINTEFKLFSFGNFPTEIIFVIGYAFILLLTSIITFAIFVKPHVFKKLLEKVFSLSLLKRWRKRATKTSDEIIITSHEMKGKSIVFWAKAFGSTLASWTARFLVINALILVLVAGGDHFLIYARQLVMWVILLISPTPGGSGVAEFMLPKFLGEFMNGYGNEIALGWRLLSYYSYLIIGSIVLPIWLHRVYRKRK